MGLNLNIFLHFDLSLARLQTISKSSLDDALSNHLVLCYASCSVVCPVYRCTDHRTLGQILELRLVGSYHPCEEYGLVLSTLFFTLSVIGTVLQRRYSSTVMKVLPNKLPEGAVPITEITAV